MKTITYLCELDDVWLYRWWKMTKFTIIKNWSRKTTKHTRFFHISLSIQFYSRKKTHSFQSWLETCYCWWTSDPHRTGFVLNIIAAAHLYSWTAKKKTGKKNHESNWRGTKYDTWDTFVSTLAVNNWCIECAMNKLYSTFCETSTMVCGLS